MELTQDQRAAVAELYMLSNSADLFLKRTHFAGERLGSAMSAESVAAKAMKDRLDSVEDGSQADPDQFAMFIAEAERAIIETDLSFRTAMHDLTQDLLELADRIKLILAPDGEEYLGANALYDVFISADRIARDGSYPPALYVTLASFTKTLLRAYERNEQHSKNLRARIAKPNEALVELFPGDTGLIAFENAQLVAAAALDELAAAYHRGFSIGTSLSANWTIDDTPSLEAEK